MRRLQSGNLVPGALDDTKARRRAGVVVARRDAALEFASASTSDLVTDYVGPFIDGRLPGRLGAWLAASLAGTTAGPFLVERAGRRFVARIGSTRDLDEVVILIEEDGAPRGASSLAPHRLTRRESEVLWWVTEGKTNREIAMILGRSARTVQLHLNRVYRKLGVETRTAAAALMLRTNLTRDLELRAS